MLLPRDPALQSAAVPRGIPLVSEHAGLRQPCCPAQASRSQPPPCRLPLPLARPLREGQTHGCLPVWSQTNSFPLCLLFSCKSLPKAESKLERCWQGESERHSLQASSPCGLGSAERLALSRAGNSPRRAVLWWVEMSTSTATG